MGATLIPLSGQTFAGRYPVRRNGSRIGLPVFPVRHDRVDRAIGHLAIGPTIGVSTHALKTLCREHLTWGQSLACHVSQELSLTFGVCSVFDLFCFHVFYVNRISNF